jgi:uncharacterized protein YlzI (FlbEa/FlbD family)
MSAVTIRALEKKCDLAISLINGKELIPDSVHYHLTHARLED